MPAKFFEREVFPPDRETAFAGEVELDRKSFIRRWSVRINSVVCAELSYSPGRESADE
jgi:hypothetical protein